MWFTWSANASMLARRAGQYGVNNGCDYGMISMQIIDQVEQVDEEALADCEVYWQHQSKVATLIATEREKTQYITR